MAWSTPKTWVDQETPSADDFNTEIRDNLNVLSTHSHGGAAGDGSTTLDSVDYIDLDEGGALSAPAGGHTRFAANNDGTLRYYADGGSEKTVSDTAHSHTIASSTETKASLGTVLLLAHRIQTPRLQLLLRQIQPAAQNMSQSILGRVVTETSQELMEPFIYDFLKLGCRLWKLAQLSVLALVTVWQFTLQPSISARQRPQLHLPLSIKRAGLILACPCLGWEQ